VLYATGWADTARSEAQKRCSKSAAARPRDRLERLLYKSANLKVIAIREPDASRT